MKNTTYPNKISYKEILKDVNVLEKDFKEFIKASKNSKVIVSNAGLYNVGKSSFFNALIDSDNTEFKVADRRETSVNKVYSWTNEIDLVDTPGIDAFNDSDKSVALESFKTADVILFLHNINQGELVRSEIEFIEELTALFPNREFWKRVIFIMTRIDSKEDDPEYPKIVSSIKNQISNISDGNSFKFFEVSSEKYLQGLKENFDILMDESNIIDVRNEIKSIASSLLPEKNKLNEERKKYYIDLLKENKELLICIKEEKQSIINEKQRLIIREQDSLKRLTNNVRNRWESVRSYKNSI